MSSKKISMMKGAQTEKTKQTIEQLVEWYASKEKFYKIYLPIQQSIAKKLMGAAELTMGKLRDISAIVKEEEEIQAFLFEKRQKNTLSNESLFRPKFEEMVDSSGIKTKVQLPVWSGNIDRIFVSLGRHQRQKQNQIKKISKILELIIQSVSKMEGKYKGEIKKAEKDLDGLFSQIDEAEKEESKILGKLIKEAKTDQIKQSDFFIGEIKKMEKLVMNEIGLFADRGKKIIELIETILRLEKEVAKAVKQNMTAFLNYRKNFLGIDMKEEEDVWGQVTLCEQKVQVERVSYFNKTLLSAERVDLLSKLMPGFEAKNNWQVVVKFLQISRQIFSDLTGASANMLKFLKTISYRCWSQISLAQGWLIESYTPSIMYMTYDYIMIIYNKDGDFLKRIHTTSSKVSKVEGNIVFLQEKVKGFFSDSLEEYKLRFDESERLEQFQLFMENQIV